jgi:ATP-dependent RNA helicase RhlE
MATERPTGLAAREHPESVSSFFHRSRRRGAKRDPWRDARPPQPSDPRPAGAEPVEAPPAAFVELGLAAPLLRAIGEQRYAEPTPVQRAVVPQVLAGRDVLACAQTGTGKTAAFLLPILQRLAAEPPSGRIRALVLTPTRELAAQIVEHAGLYGRHLRLRHAVIYGGVGQGQQERALRARPDLLVATPGRLLDLMNQRLVDLGGVSCFVLDEADRMLDMGFIHDVRRIASCLPGERQTLLFSATMPHAIEQLARQMLVTPERVAIAPKVTTAETVEQSVVFVARADKRATLVRMLEDAAVERALVFTRTKHGASRLADQLQRAGIESAAIHGNKSQGQRDRALAGFRRGTTRVLVATDVAARGIDVDGVSHVINFDVPDVPETYVHRIGRTGRAGASGRAILFCDGDERRLLADIERLIRRRLPAADLAPTSPQLRGQKWTASDAPPG